MTEVRLANLPFFPSDELASFMRSQVNAGAIVNFTGLARPQTRDGKAVRSLLLEHHPSLTLKSLETIATATRSRFGVERLRIVHRYGTILAGEAIVFVAAASAHRRAAYQAVDYAMDRLKSEAVFWKREHYDEGSAWIEPTETDASDLARWSD